MITRSTRAHCPPLQWDSHPPRHPLGVGLAAATLNGHAQQGHRRGWVRHRHQCSCGQEVWQRRLPPRTPRAHGIPAGRCCSRCGCRGLPGPIATQKHARKLTCPSHTCTELKAEGITAKVLMYPFNNRQPTLDRRRSLGTSLGLFSFPPAAGLSNRPDRLSRRQGHHCSRAQRPGAD